MVLAGVGECLSIAQNSWGWIMDCGFKSRIQYTLVLVLKGKAVEKEVTNLIVY